MNPVQCPACVGRGSHPGSAPRKRVRCKGCDGKGLLWCVSFAPFAPAPVIQPMIPYIGPMNPYIVQPQPQWIPDPPGTFTCTTIKTSS